MSCHSLLACRVSAEKTADNFIGIPLYVIFCFYYLLFVFNFCQFDYCVPVCVPPWVNPVWQGSPTPRLQTSISPRPVRNRATQQEVSSRPVSEASSAAPHLSPSLALPPDHPPPPPTPIHGKIVFHKTGPWCQKGWGPLLCGTLCTSWTWVTVSFPRLGKFSGITSSNIFSGLFFILLGPL